MEVGGDLHALAVLSPRKEPLRTHYIRDWIPEPGWTLWRREKFLDPAEN
jgi:hypothetical protein